MGERCAIRNEEEDDDEPMIPGDIEDTFRRFLFDLFDLSYNEIMCVKAIMNRKDLTEFGRDMEKLAKKNVTFTRFRAFQTRRGILKKLGDAFKASLLTTGQRKEMKA